MQIGVHKSQVKAEVRAPSSKSYTIRGLMCAGLAEGRSHLIDPLQSEDSESALRVLRQIGVEICAEESDRWSIRGGRFRVPQADLFCGDSAATLRFMLALCALVPGPCQLTAGESLSKRPLQTLVEALKPWGVEISARGEYPPVKVMGGGLEGGSTALAGDISSQYVSALLLAAPLARKGGLITLTTELESKPYVLMTIQCLAQFGIEVAYDDNLRKYQVAPQKYRATEYRVEGDWSSASYLLALGALAGEVKVTNLDLRSLQGDKALVDYLEQMGAGVERGADYVTIKKEELRALEVDLNECIDLLPTVAVLAASAQGTSHLTGIERARLKESNRISAVRQGLERAGIGVQEEVDGLIIQGGKPQPALIDSSSDHRIAMAFSLIGAAAGGIAIQGAECVAKTFPDYWQSLEKMGVELDEQ